MATSSKPIALPRAMLKMLGKLGSAKMMLKGASILLQSARRRTAIRAVLLPCYKKSCHNVLM